MKLLRSARFPAILLLSAAILALIVANSPLGEAAKELQHAHLGVPGGTFDLSIGHWIQDGLLAIFFFAVAVELQYELTSGELRSPRRAVQPAIAAVGGVVVPIAVYLAFTLGSGVEDGWPIPTATDIAFALGVLAVFGRGLPSRVRIFLLALAILDDVVGIIFIAVLFTTDVDLGLLAIAVLVVAVFGFVSRRIGGRGTVPLSILLVILAVITWGLVYASGVHATIAGVLLGLAVSQQVGLRARHTLEPWINAVILPVFAFSAALVVIPQVGIAELSPAFWGILVALPVGKLVGIGLFGWIAMRIGRDGGPPHLAFGDILAAGALGGIGFTVSLLLTQLAFGDGSQATDEGTLAVLAGSLIALILSGILVSWRAAHHRRLGTAEQEEAAEAHP